MTKTQDITEKLQSGLSTAQVIALGFNPSLVYKVNRDIKKGIKREINSKNSKVSGENNLKDNVDIENDPDIMALKKELRKAELERQLAEIKVPIGLESRIEALEEKVEEPNDQLDYLFSEYIDLRSLVDNTPLSGLLGRFKCSCGEKGMVAVPVQCTACEQEILYGHFPERKTCQVPD